MAKPVLFAVDDDAAILSAVTRDLRRRYAERFRVMRADSGAGALEALEELRRREETVALFLVDQRMPHMSGVEFLAQAMPIYPDARRVLLTAYADTDAAIEAINAASVHYYLVKPWDPPEEQLYPVLDDQLEEWEASYRPPFEGLRVVGYRWSPEAHEIKDFLARNHVPYLYLDVETDPAAREVLDRFEAAPDSLPLVVLPGGETLAAPEPPALAERIGLRTQADQPFYDLVIVGAGPGGLAAAVYGASEGLRTVLVERQAPGGQAGTSSRIENYLGFPAGISGGELARRAVTQVRRFGVELLTPQEATGLRADGPYQILRLADGSEVASHALIVAVGLEYRTLDAPGVERLAGAGVYYGASITEASSCRDCPVFIVGAGNSAGQAAMYLSQYAGRVTMLVRGASLEAKMSQYLVDRIRQTPNIEVLLEAEVAAVEGQDHVEAVAVRHVPSGSEETRDATALFVFTGAVPCTGWLRDTLRCDREGFVLTGSQLLEGGRPLPGWPLERPPYLLESSVPGVFAVGDVRAGSVKRVASAVGEGSIAVQFVHEHLSRVR